jgi:tetratricopeptide (TPR) repeat protein
MTDSACLSVGAAQAADPELRRLAGRVADARLHHDANYVLRRAALLHTDAVLLTPPPPDEPVSSAVSTTPQRVRIQMVDGQELGVRQTPVHWEIARMVLDYVQPAGIDRPAPSKDAMVRQWYRATAAWMQQVEDHDTLHLDRARVIFPDDPDLEFLTGCQRESYAAPAIQAGMRTAVLPSGFTVGVGNDRTELHVAETHLRRALAIRPDFPEARLRLGRVLAVLGRHEDAARELAQAEASVDDALLRYFATLFLGAEEEALGRYDAAREAYEHAAAIYPMAQSPWLALSELARRRGDRPSALRALQQMFELPSAEPERDDPWWTYHIAQARNAAELLDAVRRPFLPEATK